MNAIVIGNLDINKIASTKPQGEDLFIGQIYLLLSMFHNSSNYFLYIHLTKMYRIFETSNFCHLSKNMSLIFKSCNTAILKI